MGKTLPIARRSVSVVPATERRAMTELVDALTDLQHERRGSTNLVADLWVHLMLVMTGWSGCRRAASPVHDGMRQRLLLEGIGIDRVRRIAGRTN